MSTASKDPFNDASFVARFDARRNEDDSVNRCIDDPAILERVKALGPADLLEVGCATGMLTLHLSELCDSVFSIDRSELMISKAKGRVLAGNTQFQCVDFLEYTGSRTFDAIVSSMTTHLIGDFDAFVAKARSLLRDHGKLIFSQRHPFRTANPNGFDDTCDGPSWKLDNYFQSGVREYQWLGSDFYCFHRGIGEIISSLIHGGFRIDEVCEPLPQIADKSQRIVEHSRIPSVILFCVTGV